jgi:hypothetical protein
MPAKYVGVLPVAVLMGFALSMGAQGAASPYAVAAPLSQYMMANESAEVALARSAAPAAISDGAEVLVLGKEGYRSVAKGGNGFVCLVERSFSADVDFPAVKSAWAKKELMEPGDGAMSYMMSKGQYLGDDPQSWHPHLMWFVAGDAAKSWGANLAGSPVMAASDPADGMTILLVAVGKWSDGTVAPAMGK